MQTCFFNTSYLAILKVFAIFPAWCFFGGWDLVLWISIAPKKAATVLQPYFFRLQLRRVSHGYGTEDDEEFALLKAAGEDLVTEHV